MKHARLPLEVAAASFFPAPVRRFIEPLEPAMQRLIVPDALARSFTCPLTAGAADFADDLLRNLGIRYEIPQADFSRIPRSGSAIMVSNHPFGFLEGMVFLSALEKVRSDFRIVANSMLYSVPQLRERLIPVDPFQKEGAALQNSKGLRACLEWLRSEGLLIFFPAGEVSHLNWHEQPVADPKWNTTAARLARKVGCGTLPVFFYGYNSVPFQLMGTIHPKLRTLSLPRELAKKRNQTVHLAIGTSISASILRNHPDAESATEYTRSRTYLLRNRLNPAPHPTRPRFFIGKERQPVEKATPANLMLKEISALDPSRALAAQGHLTVYLASASEIPNVLHEIGRCRELAFREVGEGTRNSLDLDEFDQHYQHMFIWDAQEKRVAGGYRIVATPDVLPTRGVKGLYTNTLFRYEPSFFERIGPAFELGRSFVCAEYQKHYAPLLLLWKAIIRSVQRRPECPVLFGAVSISSDYHSISRELIVDFLTGRVDPELAAAVRPRRGYRRLAFAPKYVKQLSHLLANVDELSSSVSDVEPDGKGVPVLIRHYLKVGGQLLGFNVDPHFSNALDALVLADLRSASPAMLDRCMGKERAACFRAWHAARNSTPALKN